MHTTEYSIFKVLRDRHCYLRSVTLFAHPWSSTGINWRDIPALYTGHQSGGVEERLLCQMRADDDCQQTRSVSARSST